VPEQDKQTLSNNEAFLLEAWISDNPGSPQAKKLARNQLNQGNYYQAAQVLQRLVAIRPDDIQARSMLAEAMAEIGQTEDAVDQLWKAVYELKSHRGILDRLADMLIITGQPRQADLCRQVSTSLNLLRLEDTSPEPAVGRTATMAEIYASQGHISQAVEIYRGISQSNPEDKKAAARLEELQALSGKGETEKQKQDKALRAITILQNFKAAATV